MAAGVSVKCELYASAFPSEVVFAFKTMSKGRYEGVAPKHYAKPTARLSKSPVGGTVRVRLIREGGAASLIATPDGEMLEVATSIIEASE